MIIVIVVLVVLAAAYFIYTLMSAKKSITSTTSAPTTTGAPLSTTSTSTTASTPLPYPPTTIPPVTGTGFSRSFVISNQLYGNGTYETSQSSSPDVNNEGWLWHNALNGGDFSSGPSYHPDGTHNGGTQTVVDGVSRSGEWIQIKFPTPLAMKSWAFTSRAGAPTAFVIAGSNDGNAFNMVLNQTTNLFAGATATTHVTATIPVNSNGKYQYYRMVALSTTNYSHFDGSKLKIYATA